MLNDVIYRIKKQAQWLDVEAGELKINKNPELTGKRVGYFINVSVAKILLDRAMKYLEKAQKDYDRNIQWLPLTVKYTVDIPNFVSIGH